MSAFAALGAALLIGFFAGHHSSGRAEGNRAIPIPGGRLTYASTSTWRQTSAQPPLPALPLTAESALAPGGDASKAALVAGQLNGRLGPLPAPFVALFRAPPDTQVVYLPNAEAFRYSNVELSGYVGAFTVYAVAMTMPRYTVIVCRAPAADSLEMHECEAIATSLTSNASDTGGGELTPDPFYASELRTAVDGFDRLRASLRPELTSEALGAARRALAVQLAAAAAHAAASVAEALPPFVARGAQATLAASLTQASSAYSRLATALAGGSESGYASARSGVEASESQIDSALAYFSVLGYESA